MLKGKRNPMWKSAGEFLSTTLIVGGDIEKGAMRTTTMATTTATTKITFTRTKKSPARQTPPPLRSIHFRNTFSMPAAPKAFAGTMTRGSTCGPSRLSTHAFAFSPSIGYYFAMQRSGQAAHQTYNDLIGRRGRVLSLTVNDDLVPVRRGGGGASSIAASTYGLHISPASPLRAAVAGRVGPPFRLQYRGDGADAAKAVLEKRLAVAAVVAAEGLRTTSDGQLRRQMLAFDGAADDEMVESKTRREQLAGGHQDRVAYWRSRRAKHYNLDAFGRRKDFGGRCTNDGEHICAQKQQQITTRNAARN